MTINKVYNELNLGHRIINDLDAVRESDDFNVDNKYSFNGSDILDLLEYITFSLNFIKGCDVGGGEKYNEF